MKKRSAIIKLSMVVLALIIGLVLSFVSFPISKTYDYNSFTKTIKENKLGLDLKGGIYAVYQADVGAIDDVESSMDGTVKSLQDVLTGKGYTEATVVREGNYRIRVEVPAVDSPEQILDILGNPAELEFYLSSDGTTEPTGEPFMTGKNVVSAELGYQDGYGVSLKLDAAGADVFGDITSNHSGEYIWIYTVIGGEKNVISRATINDPITTGNAFISMGSGSDETAMTEAKELADRITSGTFSVTLSLMESSTISASLGENALNMGLLAGLIGFALIIIFMCSIYRGFGLLSSLGLMIYTIVVLFFIAIFPWVQLTLPGIAGILLSIGMAVDGNVVIFERIKDEYRNGKSIMSASNYGFKKAAVAIIDSNVVTIIAAILLLIFGTGAIQGFAMTLLIGIVFSFLNSIFVTRFLIKQSVAINSTNAKWYNLKRGVGFEDVNADQNDAAIQIEIDKEESEKAAAKRRRREEKERERGGVAE